MSDFYKGNLVEKKQVVESSSAAGDSSIAIAALDFSISAYDALSSDTDFINLVETSVKSLTAGNSKGKEKIIAEKLRMIFKTFSDSKIKIAVIDAFSVFQSPENLYLVNDFFYSKMQKSQEMDAASMFWLSTRMELDSLPVVPEKRISSPVLTATVLASDGVRPSSVSRTQPPTA